jgi:hypothetical protein
LPGAAYIYTGPDLVSSLLLAAQHAVSNLMVQGRQGVRVIPEKIHIWGQVGEGVCGGVGGASTIMSAAVVHVMGKA